MLKRAFDFLTALLLLILLSPLFVLIGLWILLDSKGGVFYLQTRVGRHGKPFKIFKFRTMRSGSDKKGLLTVGMKDSRITRAGYFLRKYKLDELPQLLNVFLGHMSLVGPRPEVEKYVRLYTEEQRRVLQVKPGITDEASMAYSRENEILSRYPDAEKAYIEIVMPEKLALNLKYVAHQSLRHDFSILLKTVKKVLFG